jgi:hypothetical protein
MGDCVDDGLIDGQSYPEENIPIGASLPEVVKDFVQKLHAADERYNTSPAYRPVLSRGLFPTACFIGFGLFCNHKSWSQRSLLAINIPQCCILWMDVEYIGYTFCIPISMRVTQDAYYANGMVNGS